MLDLLAASSTAEEECRNVVAGEQLGGMMGLFACRSGVNRETPKGMQAM